jgi:hypothetical protein
MWNARKAAMAAAVAIASATPFVVHAQAQAPAAATSVTQTRFADGNDWQKSSLEQKRAFLFGIANAISVAVGWDARHVSEGQVTFSRRAAAGLDGTSLADAVNRIDAWYTANPNRLDMPVVGVLWLDIAKPKLEGRK